MTTGQYGVSEYPDVAEMGLQFKNLTSGSRLSTTMADTDAVIGDALARFDRVRAGIGPA